MTPALDSPSDSLDCNRRLSLPTDFFRLAVVCSAALRADAGMSAHRNWPSGASDSIAAGLAVDGRVTFDYFPVRYAGPGAEETIDEAFDAILKYGDQPYDLIVVIGDASIPADIGIVHRVLTPRIAASTIPVLTALGPDDAETILGDTACRVFPTPDALIGFVADTVDAQRRPADQLLAGIQSLGGFLLAEHEVESKILLESILRPTLRKHFEAQLESFAAARRDARRVARLLDVRLLREQAALEQYRARIGIEVARLARNHAAGIGDMQKEVAPPVVPDGVRTRLHIDRLRTVLLIGFLVTVGLLWWWTTPANTVFFGGCALVAFSAVYVAISNRIIDLAGDPENETDYDPSGENDASGPAMPPVSLTNTNHPRSDQ